MKGSRDPKKNDFTPVKKSHKIGPGPTHNKDATLRESKDNKLSNHRLSNIPPVFPYEGRAALFAELQQFSDQVRIVLLTRLSLRLSLCLRTKPARALCFPVNNV